MKEFRLASAERCQSKTCAVDFWGSRARTRRLPVTLGLHREFWWGLHGCFAPAVSAPSKKELKDRPVTCPNELVIFFFSMLALLLYAR
jgi:hypothetical protein